MRIRLVVGIVTLLMAIAPFEVMAQTTRLDPEQRAIVEALAKKVGYLLKPGLAAPTEIVEEVPESEEPQETPVPEVEDPKSEPADEPLNRPELDLTDLTEYSNEGVTIQVPAAWSVELSPEEDATFFIQVPESETFIGVGTEETYLFPSLMAVALFRSQADILMADFSDEAQVDESATTYTAQGLPMAKMAFSGEEFGEPVAGTFYVTAANEETYLIVGTGSQEELLYIAPGLELIAESITFDEENITVKAAGDKPLVYRDNDGAQEVTVPAGWFFHDIGDATFPVLMLEPEGRYLVTAAPGAAFGEDFEALLAESVPAEGELDPAEHEALVTAILDMMSATGNEILMKDKQSEIVSHEGGVRVRIEGDVDFGDDLIMPVAIYADLRGTDGSVGLIFGDIEAAFTQEEELRRILESVTALAE